MTIIFLTFPIRCFLSHQKIRNTTKVITFQSSAANVKQLYVTNEASFVARDKITQKHVGGFSLP